MLGDFRFDKIASVSMIGPEEDACIFGLHSIPGPHSMTPSRRCCASRMRGAGAKSQAPVETRARAVVLTLPSASERLNWWYTAYPRALGASAMAPSDPALAFCSALERKPFIQIAALRIGVHRN
jgi:hypothetical protein